MLFRSLGSMAHLCGGSGRAEQTLCFQRCEKSQLHGLGRGARVLHLAWGCLPPYRLFSIQTYCVPFVMVYRRYRLEAIGKCWQKFFKDQIEIAANCRVSTLALSNSNQGSGSPSSANCRRAHSALRPASSSKIFFLT